MFSLSTLYFTTVDCGSLTMQIKQWERKCCFRLSRRLWGGMKDKLPLKRLCRKLLAGLQIRYEEMVFKGSLIFRSASILCTWAMFWFVLHYIFLDVPRTTKLERSLTTLNGEQNWSQTVRFLTAFLWPLAEMANVCLSLGGGHVFATSSACSAIAIYNGYHVFQ